MRGVAEKGSVMEKKKVWKLNVVLHALVLVLAIIVVGFNIYDFIHIRQIDWFNACLAIVMIFSSVLGIKTARRELRKEK